MRDHVDTKLRVHYPSCRSIQYVRNHEHMEILMFTWSENFQMVHDFYLRKQGYPLRYMFGLPANNLQTLEQLLDMAITFADDFKMYEEVEFE